MIRNRYRICQRYFIGLLKDATVLVLFMISHAPTRENADKEWKKYLDYAIFAKLSGIPQLLAELETKLQVGQSMQNWIKLVKLEALILILAHIACCIFLRIGLSQWESGSQNWIVARSIDNMNKLELYIVSYYYMIITMTTIGYGEFYPETQCNTSDSPPLTLPPIR